MSQTNLDRLIAALPADLQARVLGALNGYSPDGNDPVECLFGASFETANRNTAAIRDEIRKLQLAIAAVETREKSRDDQQTRAIRAEIQKLNPNGFWRRLVVASLVTVIGSIVIGIAVSARSASHVVEKMAGKSVALVADQQALILKQNETLNRFASESADLVKYMQCSQALAQSVTETADAMAIFAAALHQRGIYVENQDGWVTFNAAAGDIIPITNKSGATIGMRFGPLKNDNLSKLQLRKAEADKIRDRLIPDVPE
jgi:hypothetical protein